ncbi:MAG: toll/interleukin-1 receptor domain-containing protein [Sphingomonas sp.]
MSGRTVAQDLQAQSDALLQPAQRDFFISYTGKNLELAQEVGAILREAGFTFYAQFQDFDTGSNFVLGMQDGLRHSKRVIALVSPAYVRAPHCRTEWAAAYNSDPEGKARRLLPFLIEETDQDPLGLQIVYKRLVGLSQADRKRVILETISAQPLTPEAVQLLRNLAEATSPDFRAVDKTKLHGEPNAKLDTPEYGDELASLPTTQRTIAGLLIECLSDNVPPVIRRCLSQYREHLADHGVRPMVGLLAQIHSAIDAEFNIFGRTNIGDGAADLLASFGKNHRQLMTHFPGNAQREGLYRRNPVREEAASGDALFNPIKEVAGYLREIAALGQTTEEFDRILAVWEQYASDIAHLPPAPPGRTGEASPKQRLVLSSIGYMRRIQEVIQSTPALRNTVPGEVLLRRLPHIIDTFLGFVK